MVSSGDIEKLTGSSTIGKIDVSKITITQNSTVTVTVKDDGTVTLSGGATVSNN